MAGISIEDQCTGSLEQPKRQESKCNERLEEACRQHCNHAAYEERFPTVFFLWKTLSYCQEMDLELDARPRLVHSCCYDTRGVSDTLREVSGLN